MLAPGSAITCHSLWWSTTSLRGGYGSLCPGTLRRSISLNSPSTRTASMGAGPRSCACSDAIRSISEIREGSDPNAPISSSTCGANLHTTANGVRIEPAGMRTTPSEVT
ncbi:unannotated protein [freshwater metagenome]|uniref:Unannotated protein n=1 Tax=freshwater metagenome TaxID=449393 RepID=A0A6J6YHA7_9ZZZZ